MNAESNSESSIGINEKQANKKNRKFFDVISKSEVLGAISGISMFGALVLAVTFAIKDQVTDLHKELIGTIIDLREIKEKIGDTSWEIKSLGQEVGVLSRDIEKIKLYDTLEKIQEEMRSIEKSSNQASILSNMIDRDLSTHIESSGRYEQKVDAIYDSYLKTEKNVSVINDSIEKLVLQVHLLNEYAHQRSGILNLENMIVSGESIRGSGSLQEQYAWMTRARYFIKNLSLPEDNLIEKISLSSTKSRINYLCRRFKSENAVWREEAITEVSQMLYAVESVIDINRELKNS